MLALSRLPEKPAIFGMWFPLFVPDKVPHTATAGAHSTPTRLAAGRHDQRPPRRVSCTLGLWQDHAVQVAVPRRPPAIAQRSPQRILPGLVVAGPRGETRLDPSGPLLLTATTGRLLCVRPRSGRTRKPVGLPGRRRPLRRSLPGRRALPHSRRVALQGDRRQQRNPAALRVIHLVEHSNKSAQCGMPASLLSQQAESASGLALRNIRRRRRTRRMNRKHEHDLRLGTLQ